MAVTMNDLWEDKEFHKKLKTLNPLLQTAFIKALERMYNQESSQMLSFIDVSRDDMKNTAEEIKEEQEILKDTAEILAAHRRLRPPSGRTGTARSTRSAGNYNRHPSAKVQYENERGSAYHRRHHRSKGDSQPNERVPPLYTPQPSASTSQPEFSTGFTYEEEAGKVVGRLVRSSNAMQREQERQTELLEQKKERKKAKKIERESKITGELIREVSNVERVKEEDKVRQEQKLKDRLEEKKKKKKKHSGSDGDALEDAEDDGSGDKEKKKKKKKKKDKDQEEEAENIEGAEAADDTKEKKKKKKKHKSKDDEEGAEDKDTKKDKKKKKKKDKNKDQEAAMEMLEV